MNFNHQKQITLVSDIKFVLTRLDPVKQKPLMDILNNQIDRFEKTKENFNAVISMSISEIESCISENNINNREEIPELLRMYTAFLPQ